MSSGSEFNDGTARRRVQEFLGEREVLKAQREARQLMLDYGRPTHHRALSRYSQLQMPPVAFGTPNNQVEITAEGVFTNGDADRFQGALLMAVIKNAETVVHADYLSHIYAQGVAHPDSEQMTPKEASLSREHIQLVRDLLEEAGIQKNSPTDRPQTQK